MSVVAADASLKPIIGPEGISSPYRGDAFTGLWSAYQLLTHCNCLG